MKFESVEQVEKFAADNNKTLVINGQEVLDVTTFAKHHPGSHGLMQAELGSSSTTATRMSRRNSKLTTS